MFSKIKRHLLAILSVCMLLDIAIPLSKVIAQENGKIEDSAQIGEDYQTDINEETSTGEVIIVQNDDNVIIREPQIIYEEEPYDDSMEIVEKRTTHSKTYQLSEDHFVTEYYLAPIFKEIEGEFIEIDNTIIPNNSLLNNESSSYTNEEGLYNFVISNNQIYIQNDEEDSLVFSYSGNLENYAIRENAILYSSIYDGMDLEFRLNNNSISQIITFNGNIDINSYSYDIQSNLNCVQTDNSINFVKNEEIIFSIDDPVMIDQNGNMKVVDVAVSNNQDHYQITLNLDEEWINDDEIIYPIQTLNTVSIQSTAQLESEIKTSYIRSKSKNVTSNYSQVFVGNDLNEYGGEGSNIGIARTFLNFTLPDLGENQVITDATLKMYKMNTYIDSSKSEWSKIQLSNTDKINTASVTWNNQPTDLNILKTVDIGSGYGYKDFDITEHVRQLYNGENKTLVLKATNESSSYRAKVFYSESGAYPPKITITHETDVDEEALNTFTGELHIDKDRNIEVDGTTQDACTVLIDLLGYDEATDSVSYISTTTTTSSSSFVDTSYDSDTHQVNYTTEGLNFPQTIENDRYYVYRIKTRINDVTSSSHVMTDGFMYYKVKANDTLANIARTYGLEINEIKTWNQLTTDKVKEDDVLLLLFRKDDTSLTKDHYRTKDASNVIDEEDAHNSNKCFGICEIDAPVNITTGNFIHAKNDFTITDFEKISFIRTYNSNNQISGNFGKGFTSNFEETYTFTKDEDILLFRGDGRVLEVINTNGTYSIDPIYETEVILHLNDERYSINYDEQRTVDINDITGMSIYDQKEKKNYIFNEKGQLTRIENQRGKGIGITHDEYGRINEIDISDKTIAFSYNSYNLVDTITLPNDEKVKYIYNEFRQLIEVRNVDGYSEIYTYFDNSDLIETIIDKKSNDVIKNTYDEDHNIIQYIDGESNITEFDYSNGSTTVNFNNSETITYSYNDDHRITQITPNDGHIRYFVYDNNGDLKEEKNAEYTISTITYNHAHQPLTKTYYDGTTFLYEYYENGNIKEIIDRNGIKESNVYNDLDQLIETTDTKGVKTTYEYDSQNRVIEQTTKGITTVYTYDGDDELYKKETRSDGYWVEYIYDEMGNVLQTKDSNDRIFQYIYDENSNTIQITDPMGYIEQFEYDENSNMIQYIDKENASTTYEYDKNNNLVKIVKSTSITLYEYDHRNRIIKESDELGVKSTFTYNNLGQKTSETDRYGKMTTFEYDEIGRLEKETDPLGNTKIYQYDHEKLISQTDEYGKTTTYSYTNDLLTGVTTYKGTITYEYNTFGSITKTIDERNNVTIKEYDEYQRVKKEISPTGVVTSYEYDGFDNIVKKTVDEQVTVFTYDQYQNKLTETNVYNKIKYYEYDKLDRLTKETDEMDHVTIHEYNKVDTEIKTTDALNNSKQSVYDQYQLLVQEIDELGYTLTYTYNELGQLISTKDDNDVITSFTYDDYGNLKKTSISSKVIEENFYDEYGRKTKVVTPSETIEYVYDVHDRITEEKYITKGYTIIKEYDDRNNLLKETDSNNRITSYEYDIYDQLIKTTDPMNRISTNIYDIYGRLGSETSFDGTTTSNVHDKYDRVIKEVDIYGKETIHIYDLLGRVITTTTPKQVVTTFTYDDCGRVIEEKENFTDTSIYYEYDALGRKISETDKLGNKTSYEYDKKGQLVKIIDPYLKEEKKEYDIYGNIIKETDKSNNSTQTQYNEFGLIVKEVDKRGFSVIYEYNEQLLISKMTDKLGNSIIYTYDNHNNVSSIKNQNEFITEYEYDIYGNVTMITDPNNNVTTKEYDSLDHVVKVISPNLTTQYIYDSRGRLTETKENEVSIQKNTYNDLNQLIRQEDALGRITTHEYDGFSRLLKTNDKEFITEFIYDVLDREIGKVENTDKITTTSYDVLNRIIEVKQNDHLMESYEYDKNGNIIKEYKNKMMIHYALDDMGNIIEERYPFNDEYKMIYTYRYDASSNMIEKKDIYEHIYTYEYNANDQLIKEINSKGAVTKYEYDSLNNLIKVENALEKVVSYEYDGNNNLIKKNIYDLSATYEYDANDHLIKSTDEYGRVDSYTRDPKGRMLSHTFNDDTTLTYTYDLVGNMLTEGSRTFTYDDHDREVSAVYNNKTVSTTYDIYGNIIKVVDANNNTIDYEWDIYGNKTKISYGDQAVEYTYDDKERMTGVKENGETVAIYEYDTRNNAIKLTRGEIITITDYDDLSRKINITHKQGETTLATYAYTYDGENNILTETIDGLQNEYRYDLLDELTYSKKYIDGEATETTYVYDLFGNKSESSTDGTGKYYTYENGHVTSISEDGTKVTSVYYNSRGNIRLITYRQVSNNINFNDLSAYDINYSYDVYGQLIGIIKKMDSSEYLFALAGDYEYSYQYDADGDRINQLRKNRYSSTSQLGYDWIEEHVIPGMGDDITSISEEESTSGIIIGPITPVTTYKIEFKEDDYKVDKTTAEHEVLSANYYAGETSNNIYGNEERLYTDEMIYLNGLNNSVYGIINYKEYRTQDGTFPVLPLSDEISIKKIEYDDYGVTADIKKGYGYNGEMLDGNGLLYLRERYYSPELTQFIQIDSYTGEVDDLLTQNRYAYCLNNPYKYTDRCGNRAVMNIGLDGGSKKKTSKPIKEKPNNNKSIKSTRKADNQTVRTSQKAKQSRKKATQSKQNSASRKVAAPEKSEWQHSRKRKQKILMKTS